MHLRTKAILSDAMKNWRSLIFNLVYFRNRSQYDNDLASLRNSILSLPSEIRKMFSDECTFIENIPLDQLPCIVFPYPIAVDNHHANKIESGMESGFPYVIHTNGTRLFLKRGLTCNEAVEYYKYLVEREGLLGTGILAKSPHCYQDNDFKVEDGDILLDVGCAEAIFAIDCIDKVSKAYLFEYLHNWHRPLERTFAPYKDKCKLIKKLVDNKTNRKSTKLIDAIDPDLVKTSHFFVKMDIEGCEKNVIKGNTDFFKSANVKLSCCTYHRQDDAQTIEKLLTDMGYKTRFSKGYMLPYQLNGIHYPYFRHGVIYAQNY